MFSTCLIFPPNQEDMDWGRRWRLMWLPDPNDATAPNIGKKPHDPPPQA